MAVQNFTTEELATEEWKDIPGFQGTYQVSNLGRIRRVAILNGVTNRRYTTVTLRKPNEKKRRDYLVHRLVAKVFVANPNNLPTVNHKDAQKHNNRAANLEYCTPKENIQHAARMGLLRQGEQLVHLSKLTEENVRDIRQHIADTPTFHKGLASLARKLNVHRSTIDSIKSGRTWKHVK